MAPVRKDGIPIPGLWEMAIAPRDEADLEVPRLVEGLISSALRTAGFDRAVAHHTITSVYGRKIVYLSVGFTQAEHDERILDFSDWPNPEDAP